MIKIYGMSSCPDCTYVEKQVIGNEHYEIIDIGAHVRNLKQFMQLRDQTPAFDAAKRIGTVTLHPEDAGLQSRPRDTEGASCRIDGSGC